MTGQRTGKTQDARLYYIDVETGRLLKIDRARGKELPNSPDSVPNYKLGYADIREQVAGYMGLTY